jgi:hypothetical protein
LILGLSSITSERAEEKMESKGYSKSKVLTAGGVLSIIGGALEIIGGGIAVAMIMQEITLGPLVPLLPIPFLPGREIWIVYIENRFVNVAILGMVLGVIAVIGGISVLRRKHYGLSLAGAICALPAIILGIPAVIIVSMRKIEFGIEKKEKGIYGGQRRGLLIAGGISSIVAGISQIICGTLLIASFLASSIHGRGLLGVLFLPFLPCPWRQYILWDYLLGTRVFGVYVGVLIWWAIVGGFIGAMGILAVTGGISAVRRKRFGLSLAGAICALPSTIFGILAVIFVARGKREFYGVRG